MGHLAQMTAFFAIANLLERLGIGTHKKNLILKCHKISFHYNTIQDLLVRHFHARC